MLAKNECKWLDARQVLPFWCFWLVSDLFLTFPGILFNFKKAARTAKRETLLVIVKVKWLLVLEILVLVLLVLVVVEVVIVIVEVAMIRDEVDGWMDARQVLPFWCFWPVSDLSRYPLQLQKKAARAAKRETLLVIVVKVKWLLVLEILVLVHTSTSATSTSTSTSSSSSRSRSSNSNSRSSNDKRWGGWMDGC